MKSLDVWAPLAKEVCADVGGRAIHMNRTSDGWWHSEESFQPGTDYAFVVDGGAPLPDPRSHWQPQGVHGPSRIVGHADYCWHDQSWQAPPFSSAVVYELHVGTFTKEGTYAALQEHLPYFVQLGVTHLEFMPLNEFAGTRGWGYDGVDLFAPYHCYGAPDELKQLVDAAHRRGLAVLIDVVYNHLGPSGNYLNRFAPYLTDRHKTPWGQAVNLDGEHCDEVRRFFIDNALMWLRDYHFDGLRLDAVHAYIDLSAVHFLEEITASVEELGRVLGRHFTVIAESERNDPRLLSSRQVGGYEVDAQWSDDFHHALHAVLTQEHHGYYADFGTLAILGKALTHGYVVDGTYSPFRKRRHGRPLGGISGSCLLGYMQNHDQVGNRAKGERISALASLGRVKIGAALVFTAPFVPMIFQGEEWAAAAPFCYFSGHEEGWLAEAVRNGRRSEFASFGWRAEDVPDPQDKETFTRSKLDWDEAKESPHREMWAWYRALIDLRRRTPALLDGSLERVTVEIDEPRGGLLMRRGPIAVACNFSGDLQRIELRNRSSIILSSDGRSCVRHSSVELGPESVAVVVLS